MLKKDNIKCINCSTTDMKLSRTAEQKEYMCGSHEVGTPHRTKLRNKTLPWEKPSNFFLLPKTNHE